MSSPGQSNPEDPNAGVSGVVGSKPGGTDPTGSTNMDPVVTAPPCEGDPNACPLPAFPGADGAGGYVTGGRGGDVYHVTRLDTDFSDMTAGTLRYGLSNLTGPRTIVFDVSGVFSLGRTAVVGWDDNGNGWDTACSGISSSDRAASASRCATAPATLSP